MLVKVSRFLLCNYIIVPKGLEILVSVAIGFIFLKEVPSWRTAIGITIILVGFWILKGK
ncbi:hypothetical protein SAMN05443253_11319 [Bacillus sp. OK048]|nr:hypothetical protein SAMN05443253_11319 [Bacillus sp. OK048]